jgi:alkylation response protein AidB-like acyl-CoA dehydrogenase
MNLDDTPQEAAFRREVSSWLAANAPAFEQDLSRHPSMEEQVAGGLAWQAHKAKHGYGAILWPVEYGGRGGTHMEAVIFQQEQSRYKLPLGPYIGIGLGLAAPTLFAHGTKAQIDHLIPPTLNGEFTWCQLFSEPSAGSDLAGLRTRAIKDGDYWVINGQKVWNSWAAFGRYAILIARSDPTRVKHAGLTYFILDMKTPGIDVRPIKQMAGDREFCEVFLTDVRIHDSWVVGQPNGGWAVATFTLSNERMNFGSNPDQLNAIDLVEMAKHAIIRGRPAIEDSYVRERIAHFYARERGLEVFQQRLITKISRGDTPGLEGSVNKLLLGARLQEMATFAMELYGAAGEINDDEYAPGQSLTQRTLLHSAAYRIAGGADEIMRNQISEKILGLPPDIRADKGIPFNEL